MPEIRMLDLAEDIENFKGKYLAHRDAFTVALTETLRVALMGYNAVLPFEEQHVTPAEAQEVLDETAEELANVVLEGVMSTARNHVIARLLEQGWTLPAGQPVFTRIELRVESIDEYEQGAALHPETHAHEHIKTESGLELDNVLVEAIRKLQDSMTSAANEVLTVLPRSAQVALQIDRSLQGAPMAAGLGFIKGIEMGVNQPDWCAEFLAEHYTASAERGQPDKREDALAGTARLAAAFPAEGEVGEVEVPLPPAFDWLREYVEENLGKNSNPPSGGV